MLIRHGIEQYEQLWTTLLYLDEKLNNVKPASSSQNITFINAEEGNSRIVSDDLNQEDDQHIYQTLTSLFTRAAENSRASLDSAGLRTTGESKSVTLETCKNTGNINS